MAELITPWVLTISVLFLASVYAYLTRYIIRDSWIDFIEGVAGNGKIPLLVALMVLSELPLVITVGSSMLSSTGNFIFGCVFLAFISAATAVTSTMALRAHSENTQHAAELELNTQSV